MGDGGGGVGGAIICPSGARCLPAALAAAEGDLLMKAS